jgi:hypothetical protein
MFDSSCPPFVVIKYELSTKQMAVKTNQTGTLYKRNDSQDESNVNSTKQMAVKANQM